MLSAFRVIALCVAVPAVVLLAADDTRAGPRSDPLTGVWETEGGKSRVHIHSCAEPDRLCGTLIWTHNGDLSKIGLRILSGFAFDPDNARWSGGEIVDPRSGKDYRARLNPLGGDELEVEGCWFIFCGGQVWVRVPARRVDAATGQDSPSAGHASPVLTEDD